MSPLDNILIDNILTGEQQDLLAQHLWNVLRAGFGHVTMRIERQRVYWLRPGVRSFLPGANVYQEISMQPLADLLGEWLPVFNADLTRLIGCGWGTLVIMIEHGGIYYIESTPDIAISRTEPPYMAVRA